jgi:hypothetical protein
MKYYHHHLKGHASEQTILRQDVIAISLKHINLTAQEVLGRKDVLIFEDAYDLPRLDESQQYERGVHHDIFVYEDGTISIYVGCVTGAQGFVQRDRHRSSSNLLLSVDPAPSLNKLESTTTTTTERRSAIFQALSQQTPSVIPWTRHTVLLSSMPIWRCYCVLSSASCALGSVGASIYPIAFRPGPGSVDADGNGGSCNSAREGSPSVGLWRHKLRK